MLKAVVYKVLCPSNLAYLIDARKYILRKLAKTFFHYTSTIEDVKGEECD